jgi:hypothetical protein
VLLYPVISLALNKRGVELTLGTYREGWFDALGTQKEHQIS